MSEAVNSLRSSATSRVVIAMAEGEIKGLVDGDKSIYFGDTPLQAADGTYNFSGVTYEMRNGTPDQNYLAGFPAVEHEVTVDASVTSANPITRRIDNAAANAARVRVQLNEGLMFQDSTTGALGSSSVGIAIEVRPNGGVWTRKVEETITGKTTSAYERSYRVPLEGTAPWDIRMLRLTADSTSAYLRNATRWASYTEIVDRKCTYPHTALLGVAIDARKFGSSIDTTSAEIYGKILQVPSNYDPETRAYSGVWDGTFKLAWSDNAAWCFYDMVTNGRYGLGLADSGLKWYLYEIAKYSDELVPDGYGGMEPRFTCNLVLSTQQDAYQVITSMASIFRGMVYWASGCVACAQDRPGDASHLVTPAKVVDGLLAYGGTDLKSRHTVALVTWNNPADNYKVAIEVVEDAAGIRRYGWRQTDKIAVGCISRGQARRCGLWLLETELNELDLLTYSGGLEYADAVPGCILKVMDPEVADVRAGGQVKAATTTQVTLDAPVELVAGQEYTLSVVLPDKTVATAIVADAAGETATLHLGTALSAAPVAGAIWTLTSGDLEARYFRVLSNRETKPNIYEISASEHDPNKYRRVEQGLRFDAPQVSRVPTGPLPAPSNVTLKEYLYTQGSGAAAGAVLSWGHPADARITLYEVELLTSYGEVLPCGTTNLCSLDLRDIAPGVYDVRLRSLTRLSASSPWATLEGVRLLGLTAPLPDVTGLTYVMRSTGGQMDWDAVFDVRPVRYAIRRGAVWDTALVMGYVDTPGYVPPLDGSYLVKATAGQGDGQAWSANAAVIVVSGARPVANVIAEHDHAADGWPGACSGGAQLMGTAIKLVGAGDIYASPDIYSEPLMLYLGGVADWGAYQIPTGQRLLLGAASRVSVLVDYAVLGEGIFDDLYGVPDCYALADLYGGYGASVSAIPQVSLLSGGVWGDWQSCAPGEYLAEGFDFRVLLGSSRPDVTAVLTSYKISVDVPDRVERGEALVPAAGLRIAYSTPFHDPHPSVFCQVLAAQGGEDVEITDADSAGFNIRIGAAGAYVARTINWITQGY